ncbi:hypothetical protein JW777_10720 [bacterium]|nr:hypothetical protein [bacterium]
MFHFPLILSRDTSYAKLGLKPDATANDIQDAKGEILQSLGARKQMLEKRRAGIYEAVPGLETARSRLETMNKSAEKTDPSALKKLHSEIAALEKEAVRIDPDFRKIESDLGRIDREVNDINLIELEKREERQKYDLSTPPCILLRFEEFRADVLTDFRTLLFYARKEFSRFLEEEKNIHCFHPSDLTRRIFTSDYEYNQRIDEEES